MSDYENLMIDGADITHAFRTVVRDLDARLKALNLFMTCAHASVVRDLDARLKALEGTPASATSRETGWYWVKWKEGCDWQFGHWSADESMWQRRGIGDAQTPPVVIGTRIPHPD